MHAFSCIHFPAPGGMAPLRLVLHARASVNCFERYDLILRRKIERRRQEIFSSFRMYSSRNLFKWCQIAHFSDYALKRWHSERALYQCPCFLSFWYIYVFSIFPIFLFDPFEVRPRFRFSTAGEVSSWFFFLWFCTRFSCVFSFRHVLFPIGLPMLAPTSSTKIANRRSSADNNTDLRLSKLFWMCHLCH